MKPSVVTVIQEKGPDTEKLAVEKDESEPDPRPFGAPLKRARSIWGYILGSTR